jgi:hypothetical protein
VSGAGYTIEIMDINAAAEQVDTFLQSYVGKGGRRAVERRVLPSGDQPNLIKVWVNLGPGSEEGLEEWCVECEAAIRKAIPGTGPFQMKVRADAM